MTRKLKKMTEPADIIKRGRNLLDYSQSEMAPLLGISTKAIQSYEQGWRKVPSRVLSQLFVLLSLWKQRHGNLVPCWKQNGCAPARRRKCPAYVISNGIFCWMVAGRMCKQACPAESVHGMPCVDCRVIQNLLVPA